MLEAILHLPEALEVASEDTDSGSLGPEGAKVQPCVLPISGVVCMSPGGIWLPRRPGCPGLVFNVPRGQ